MTWIVEVDDRPSYDSLTNLLSDGWPESAIVLELDAQGEPAGRALLSALRVRLQDDTERHLRTETNRSRTAERLLKRAEADIEALTERLHELEAENAALRLADEPRRRALLNELLEKFFGVRVDIT